MPQSVLLIVGVTAVCMVSPGPDMVLVMRNTLAGDRRRGFATSLGVLTGNLVHIGYCLLGLGWLIARSVAVYGALKLAGAAYLLYLGASSLRHAGRGELDTAVSASQTRVRRGSYLQGLFNNLLNPKGALFYLGVFTQVIRPGTPPLHAAVLVAAMVSTSALFWLLFVSTLHLPQVRGALHASRKTIDRVFGALLIALGLRVAIER